MRLYLDKVVLLLRVFWKHFNQNKLNHAAGYLTYNTMLAIVPLILVVFSIFTAFPVFNETAEGLKSLIFTNFAPSAGDVVEKYISQFLSNSRQMSTVGIVGLIAVALMLIHSIDRTLNDLWKETKPRPFLFSFAIYWMILTLGPILITTSIGLSSYIYSLKLFNDQEILPLRTKVLSTIPFLITWFLFTLIYTIVPNTKVNIRYAACGALIAAIFFTLGKRLFTWYISAFPSYQLIYGALATLPITLLWVQLSWIFVLLGAQFTAVLEDMRLIKAGKMDVNLKKLAPE